MNEKTILLIKSLVMPLLGFSLIFMVVYIVAQQMIRMAANDPQIQLAEDAGAILASGEQPARFDPAAKVDVKTSLAPYLIVFNSQGVPVATTAKLDGATPIPPHGVFDYALLHRENRFTWQPQPGVRIAAVLVYYSGTGNGFVLAGRSMREIEIREDQILSLVFLGWLCSILLMVVFTLFQWKNRK